jgi:large subunit ribosomal protein L24
MAGAKKSGTKKVPGMKIKKGDRVVVIAGKDRGREGTVISAHPERHAVLVEGVNLIRKNTKVDYQGGMRGGAKQGGIVTREALIHVSNVQLIDPDTKSATRTGSRVDGDKKVRVSRASGKDI